MDRLTKNYFLGMENEYRFLKFESKLLEQIADGKLLKKLDDYQDEITAALKEFREKFL